jgi:uncharacterized protein (TIGR03437 family)
VIPVLNPELPMSAPEAWVSVLGDFDGVAERDWSGAIGPDGSLPETLGGVTAEIAGRACVIGYVSRSRIDLLLPEIPEPLPLPAPLRLRWPGGAAEYDSGLRVQAPGFLMRFAPGVLIPAALGSDGEWIRPEHPAVPGDTVRFYVTGIPASAPPYDVNAPGGMQLIVDSIGLQVQQVRPVSPGVEELTVRLREDLRPGLVSVRLFARFLSQLPTLLPVAPR